MKKIINILTIWVFPLALFSQSISSFTIPKNAFKLGESFFVSIKTDAPFNANNFFIVQISDKFGSFSSSVEIGRISARADTMIPCNIPDTLPVGTNYLIRVLATNPSFTSSPYQSSIILYYGRAFYVSKNGSDDNDGSQNKPLLTIQKAIDIAWYHDTIYVGTGTYNENIKFNGIDLVLVSTSGPEKTIIDGQRNGTPVVTFENGESSATILEGFTIQNGVNYQMDNGPGITIKYQNTAPTLKNLIIKNNEAWAFGGGIFCYNAGNVKIINCKIENNKAKYFGGGIYTDNTNIEIMSSIIRKNYSGGVYNWRSFSKINNSLIYWNNSNEVTMFSDLGYQMKPLIYNSTIVATDKYYAFYIFGRFHAVISNSIIFGADSTIYLMGDAYDTLEVNHSIVYEYPKKVFLDNVKVKTGKHFFADDPMFINPNNENFSLDSCSAGIGTADKTISPPVDVFGHPRPIQLTDEEDPDIGAVENPKTQRSSFVKINKVSKSKFCKGGSFTLEYSVGGCPFVEGNEFIAELSNLSGTFNPSYELGRVKSVNSGIINCKIPSNVQSGSTYKLRIRATNLPYRSEPFSENFLILDNPKVTIYGAKQVCSHRVYEYWTDSSELNTNKWYIRNGYSNNNLSENKINVVWYDSSSGSLKLVQTNIAGCSDSTVVTVTILPTPSKPSIQQLSDGQLVSSYPSWNQWFWNGIPIQGATSRIFKPTKSGYYSVKIIPPTGCESDMSDSIYVNISEVDDLTSSSINISMLGKKLLVENFSYSDILSYKIFDVLSNEKIFDVVESFGRKVSIDLSNLATGVYFLVLVNHKSSLVYKFVVVD